MSVPPGRGDGPSETGGRTLKFLEGQPVEALKKVGARRAESFHLLGIDSVLDLLTHYPRRYVDRTRQASVAELGVGDEGLVLGEVRSVATRRPRRGRPIVEVEVDDGTGLLRVVFFNQPWRSRQLVEGTQAVFFGKLDTYRGRRQMANPVVDLVGNRTGRIVPVYPQSDKAGISSWEISDGVEEALSRSGRFADPLPDGWRRELAMLDRTEALWGIHRPDSMEQQSEARRRLGFDELLRLQLEVGMRRLELESSARGIRHDVGRGPSDLVGVFLASLPFELTGAQRHAMDAIFEDLEGPRPMHRLLQGDVGAGKTVVAVAALLVAVQGGHQGALMAPTEVLAEQHALSVRSLLADLSVPDPGSLTGERPLSVVLLTSRTPASQRSRSLAALSDGGCDILIGTHALLVEDVRFADLGVVVIDEQHRFGVEQRATLRAKGRSATAPDPDVAVMPDLLVMTATPIPRTAAMVVFGDLEVTELTELPPGRVRVRTSWARTADQDDEAWERVRTEVSAGRRAYVVCPLVEGSERVQARSATEEYERLSKDVLSGLRLGLLHGQMRTSEKEEVMDRFRRGDVQVLVTTTVIEVGVDVAEATVMVVEDADRFGIAQLHQLRGRVGRSELPSWCYLMSSTDSAEAAERLSALERTTDGFELAEVDLEQRGEGTILGARQKGRNDLKLASLRRRDRPLVESAKRVADAILGSDPSLSDPEHDLLGEEVRLLLGEEEAQYLLKS